MVKKQVYVTSDSFDILADIHMKFEDKNPDLHVVSKLGLSDGAYLRETGTMVADEYVERIIEGSDACYYFLGKRANLIGGSNKDIQCIRKYKLKTYLVNLYNQDLPSFFDSSDFEQISICIGREPQCKILRYQSYVNNLNAANSDIPNFRMRNDSDFLNLSSFLEIDENSDVIKTIKKDMEKLIELKIHYREISLMLHYLLYYLSECWSKNINLFDFPSEFRERSVEGLLPKSTAIQISDYHYVFFALSIFSIEKKNLSFPYRETGYNDKKSWHDANFRLAKIKYQPNDEISLVKFQIDGNLLWNSYAYGYFGENRLDEIIRFFDLDKPTSVLEQMKKEDPSIFQHIH